MSKKMYSKSGKLIDESGNNITWLEAIVESLKIIGHPAHPKEIYKVMLRDVILQAPESARTPIQTIFGTIYDHSHDAKSGRKKESEHRFYYSGEKGVWGLVNNRMQGFDVGMSEDDVGFPEGKAILELHLHRERNSKLVSEAKNKFYEDHDGRVYCEACGFDFCKIYGKQI